MEKRETKAEQKFEEKAIKPDMKEEKAERKTETEESKLEQNEAKHTTNAAGHMDAAAIGRLISHAYKLHIQADDSSFTCSRCSSGD